MSENVADIRPTALGKWDEQLVKNTIGFSPTSARKKGERDWGKRGGGEREGKVNIELRSIALSERGEILAVVLNF